LELFIHPRTSPDGVVDTVIEAEFGFTAHIRSRGDEARELKQKAGTRARRWVDYI